MPGRATIPTPFRLVWVLATTFTGAPLAARLITGVSPTTPTSSAPLATAEATGEPVLKRLKSMRYGKSFNSPESSRTMRLEKN
ncbi:hypothetical protein D3C76_1513530 [compost metagenome]